MLQTLLKNHQVFRLSWFFQSSIFSRPSRIRPYRVKFNPTLILILKNFRKNEWSVDRSTIHHKLWFLNYPKWWKRSLRSSLIDFQINLSDPDPCEAATWLESEFVFGNVAWRRSTKILIDLMMPRSDKRFNELTDSEQMNSDRGFYVVEFFRGRPSLSSGSTARAWSRGLR